MGKEIERKYLLKEGITLTDLSVIVQASQKRYDIKEHYFNEFTRLRYMNNKAYITIKSQGTLKRDEFEYQVMPNFYCPMPLMVKTRYCIKHFDYLFELNIFSQFKNSLKDMPLCLIEIELEDENEQIQLPFWIGQEVTEDKKYYGYNLFKSIENDYKLGLIK